VTFCSSPWARPPSSRRTERRACRPRVGPRRGDERTRALLPGAYVMQVAPNPALDGITQPTNLIAFDWFHHNAKVSDDVVYRWQKPCTTARRSWWQPSFVRALSGRRAWRKCWKACRCTRCGEVHRKSAGQVNHSTRPFSPSHTPPPPAAPRAFICTKSPRPCASCGKGPANTADVLDVRK